MNEKYINEALGGISTQNLDDALSYKRIRISFRSVTAIAAALAVVIGAGAFFYQKGGREDITTSKVESSDTPVGGVDESGLPSGEYKGIVGNTGSVALDPTGDLTRTGTACTEEQVRELIDREKNNIAQYITSENKDLSGELRIATKGYNYAQAADNTIALDRLTLPVFTEDNRVVGAVELLCVDGELKYNTLTGGTRFERITDMISNHPNDKIAFVKVGELSEVMISEDGTVCNMSEDGGDPFEGIKDKYGSYAEDENTFCLAECVKEKNYIAVRLG